MLAALMAASPAISGELTVSIGETWMFRLNRDQPVHALKAAPSTKPRPGEIRVSVRSMMGTTMTMISNSPNSYTYRAALIGPNGKAIAARSCALPGDNRLAFESWPQPATAVRIGYFKPTAGNNACP